MSRTIAGTGHRPGDRFPGDPETLATIESLCYDWLLDEQPDVVIVGMALGFDQCLARAALSHGIEVHAYIPFQGQADKWTKRQAEDYGMLLQRCAVKKIICPGGYSSAKFQRRNEAMVDACDMVLAFWDGSAGGTRNCVIYAEDKFVDVENIWDRFTTP